MPGLEHRTSAAGALGGEAVVRQAAPGQEGAVGAFIVTYRRPHHLAQTLRAVLAQARPPDLTVVLNNDPEAGIQRDVVGEFPGVHVMNLGANLGSAGGFAAALQMSQAYGLTWAWLLDDDGRPHPDALRRLLTAYGTAEEPGRPIGIVAPLQVSPRTTFGVSRWRDRPVSVAGLNGRPCDVDVAYWSGLLVHRATVGRVGLPRAEFFRCFADYEFCLRARRAGLRVLAVPESHIYHDPGRPSPVVRLGRSSLRPHYSPARTYYHARNAAFTARHTLGSRKALARHALLEARHILGDLVYSDQKALRIGLRLRGLVDGFRGRLGRRPGLPRDDE